MDADALSCFDKFYHYSQLVTIFLFHTNRHLIDLFIDIISSSDAHPNIYLERSSFDSVIEGSFGANGKE